LASRVTARAPTVWSTRATQSLSRPMRRLGRTEMISPQHRGVLLLAATNGMAESVCRSTTPDDTIDLEGKSGHRNLMAIASSRTRLSRVVNAVLVVLAFALLGWLICRNGDKIREIFGRRLDLNLFALALVISFIGTVGTFVRWFFLVR
jgi:hypothetical protein